MRTMQQTTDRVFSEAWMVSTAAIHTAVQKIKTMMRALINRYRAQSLLELDDHLMNDIGLSREELQRGLREGSYLRDPTLRLAEYARERAKKQMSKLSLG